ncbi:hypothetical protein AAY24_16775 [Sedimenticola thiotaurini]|uniref:Uncharacterized protein n=1 Tax=Sedimenticola thiotaurini TaxID=1543721 RepID=A0A0F7JZK3_9GAMM|nr:hypothetical protein AAY24_16775 [Sedimenticola thiotaurini]
MGSESLILEGMQEVIRVERFCDAVKGLVNHWCSTLICEINDSDPIDFQGECFDGVVKEIVNHQYSSLVCNINYSDTVD